MLGLPSSQELLGADGLLSVGEILAATPWWAYAILIALILMGIRESRNRVVSQYIVLGTPMGIVVLSFLSVVITFGFSKPTLPFWLVGISVTTLLSYHLLPIQQAAFHVENQRFSMPGSVLPFLVTLGVFFTKYTIVLIMLIGVAAVERTGAVLGLSFLYGLFSGLFLSRSIHLWKLRRQALLDTH